jgi:hypothetical protein
MVACNTMQKSRNSRLKDLEDRNSTNIYCTGVPIDWNELVSDSNLDWRGSDHVADHVQQDLAKHFLPYNAISTKICRDAPSGVSKEVGFARYAKSVSWPPPQTDGLAGSKPVRLQSA